MEVLELLIASAKRVAEYSSVPLEEFSQDQMRQDAVAFRLIVIGELAKRVPEEVKAKFPEVPWRDMARTRDFLAHRGYEANPKLLHFVASRLIPSQVLGPLSEAL